MAASGIASLIKVALSLKHCIIPPSLNFEVPNPYIDMCNSPVYINDRAAEWEKGETLRRAGINSFGLSGTNCHAVLEEAPAIESSPQPEGTVNIIAMSAESRDSLWRLVLRYKNCIDAEGILPADMCYTADTGRRHCRFRKCIAFKSGEELRNEIKGIESSDIDMISPIPEDTGEETLKAQKCLSEFIQDGKINYDTALKLCQSYEHGADVEWDRLYEGEIRKRVSLPTYPFEKKRCWINENERQPVITGMMRKKTKSMNIMTDIELTGRDGGTYTKTELIVGKIWGNALGKEIMDIYDNYYDDGGDSIISIKIINEINNKLGLHLEQSDMFNYPTVYSLAKVIEEKRIIDKFPNELKDIPETDKADYYMASGAQKRIYVSSEINKQSTSYNVPWFIMIDGKLDEERYEAACRKIIERHDGLRTSFDLKETPVQIVHEHVDFHIEKYAANGKDELNALIERFIRPFDLRKAPLLRVGLVRINDTSRLLMMDAHHIVVDGWSVPILQREIISAYEGFKLTKLPIQYKDFTMWHYNLLKTDYIKNQGKYWLNVFKDGDQTLNMPTDFPRPAVKSDEGDELIYHTGKDLADSINKLAEKTYTTQFMILIAALDILLYKYTGQKDITVGTPISGRVHASLEKLIGVFINTLALRNKIEDGDTVYDFLAKVKQNTLMAYKNQDYPFDKLIEQLHISHDSSHDALFDIMLILQPSGLSNINIHNIRYTPYEYTRKTSKFDIMISVYPLRDDFQLCVSYRTKLFRKETMESFIAHFSALLR